MSDEGGGKVRCDNVVALLVIIYTRCYRYTYGGYQVELNVLMCESYFY